MRVRPIAGLGLTAVLLAGAFACEHDPDRFLPTAVEFSGSLVLTASATEMPADGFSRIEIVAQINSNADSDKRTVAFTTTAGSFVGAEAATPRMLKVDADTSGQAKVQLQSSTQVETATVEAQVEGVAELTKRIEIQFLAPDADTLVLTASSASVPADGFSRVELRAQIDPDNPPDKRTVKFSASMGELIGADKDADGNVSVVADLSGLAVAELRSSETPGAAVVEAQLVGVPGAFKRIEIEFLVPDADTLVLTASADSMPADGFSRVELRAQIGASNPPDTRTVKFSASMGELIGANKDADGNVSVVADLSGLATAELRSSKVAGASVVEAQLVGVPTAFKRIEIEFTPVDPSDIITISTASSSAPADGATLTAVFADISPSLPAGQREVRFETNRGTFAGDTTVTADASNRATVDLRSPTTIGQARLRATVADTSAQTFLDFVRAFPDRLVVVPEKFSFDVSSDTELDVTVTLERDVGSVTNGTAVTYTIVKASDGTAVADVEFRGVTTSSNGKSTATLVKASGGSPPVGFAIIRASSGGVIGEETIEFVP